MFLCVDINLITNYFNAMLLFKDQLFVKSINSLHISYKEKERMNIPVQLLCYDTIYHRLDSRNSNLNF